MKKPLLVAGVLVLVVGAFVLGSKLSRRGVPSPRPAEVGTAAIRAPATLRY